MGTPSETTADAPQSSGSTGRWRRRLLATALVGALVATACSSDDAETTAADPDAATTTEAASDEADTADTDTDDAESATGAAAPVPSPGCGTSEVGVLEAERFTFDSGEEERWYLLSTPDAHDGETPLPVVVSFHGLMEGAQIHTSMTDYASFGAEEGFVTVFPNGRGEPVRWEISLDDANPDIVFVDEVLDRIGEDLCIDTSRIYATGLSNGAMMTSVLACTRADRFAAVAPVAGVMAFDDCDPARPVPMLAFHGTEDNILLYNGGLDTRAIPGFGDDGDAPPPTTQPIDLSGDGYPAAVAAWAELHGCEGAEDDERSDEVIWRTFDCPDSTAVEFVIVLGGGHAWPGSEASAGLEAVVGYTTFEVSASGAGWEFFERFSLPAPR